MDCWWPVAKFSGRSGCRCRFPRLHFSNAHYPAGQTSLNPVRDSVGPVDGSRPGSRAASVTAGPSSGTQLPPAAEGPNGSKSPLRPGPVAEATETDGGAPAPTPPPAASLPPAAHQQAGGSATNGSGALNVGAVALLFDGQQADAHKPKPDIASAGGLASSFRPDKSGYSATAGASGTQRQGSVQGGVNASGRLPSTKEAYSKYQGLTEYEIDELKRAEEEMREEALNRYAANQSTIMRIFISYIQVRGGGGRSGPVQPGRPAAAEPALEPGRGEHGRGRGAPHNGVARAGGGAVWSGS